jgi:hypothetical protein
MKFPWIEDVAGGDVDIRLNQKLFEVRNELKRPFFEWISESPRANADEFTRKILHHGRLPVKWHAVQS